MTKETVKVFAVAVRIVVFLEWGRKEGREPLTLSCSSARRSVSRSIFSERLVGRTFVMSEDGRYNEYKDLPRLFEEPGYESMESGW